MSQTRLMIYCSSTAYCLENDLEPVFKNLTQAGSFMEKLSNDQTAEIINAFAESKLLGNDENHGIERNPKTTELEDDSGGK